MYKLDRPQSLTPASRVRATWAAALAYVALTAALTYPLSIHPATTTFPGSSDRNLYVWTLAWNAHAFLHQPLHLFDANIFQPYSRTLAYSENLIGAALLVAPVQWLLQDPWLTFNLGVLLTIPLCALGAFVLAGELGLSLSASWICGMVYGFAPPRFLRVDQAHLTSVEWIPFCLAWLHRYLRTGRPADLRIAIAFLSLQVLTSGHGAVFLLLAMALVALTAVAGREGPRPAQVVRDIGLTGLLLLLPIPLVFLPYRLVQLDVGLRRELGDWTGSWTSYLASPTHVDAFLLDHAGAVGAFITANAQAYLFPGWLPLLLAVAALTLTPEHAGRPPAPHRSAGAAWRRAGWPLEALAAIVAAVALYASVGGATRVEFGALSVSLRAPWRAWTIAALLAMMRVALTRRAPFDFATRRSTVTRWLGTAAADPRTPYALLVAVCAVLAIGPPFGPWRLLYALPGFSFIRVPSRFMIVGTLGIGVLAAFGIDRVFARFTVRSPLVVTALLSVLLTGEFAVAPFDVVPVPPPPPAADRWLASQPHPLVVAELPPMDPSIPMLHSTAHWQKTVHGYSGWVPALSQAIAEALPNVPDERSLALLEQAGVTHLVVHTDLYAPGDWAVEEARLAQWKDRLVLRYEQDGGRVYTLEPNRHAPPAP